MWERGYHELTDACPTGLAYCKFKYRDAYGNELLLVTAGEPDEEDGDVAVWSWSIRTLERSQHSKREFARLASQLREEVARAKERTEKARRARRDLAISAGGLGGSREMFDRAEWTERQRQIERIREELVSTEAQIDEAEHEHLLVALEAMLIKVNSLSERSLEEEKSFQAERASLQSRQRF